MKSLRLLTVGALAAAFAATLLPRTEAYSKTGYKWPTMSVPFYVNPTNQDVSSSAAIAALQAGMAAWNTQAGTPFRYYYAGQVSTTATGYDNRNIIVFRNTTNGGTIATSYWWHSDGNLLDSDIVFWDGGRTFFTGSSGCSGGTYPGAYIEDVATHELGHSLGLNHSSVTDATMYPSYSQCSQGMRTLSADDISGAKSLYGTGSTADSAPTVTIRTPANGSTVAPGSAIAFSGSGTDTPDGDVSSRLVWRSNIDGQIGTGASFSRTLTAGAHTITATASDSTGHSGNASILVTVSSSNTAPTVTITTPATGTSVPDGTSIGFAGSASDSQSGNLTSSLVWRSNIDGQIGTGGTFARTLTPGTHTVTASVTDSGGLTGQRSVTVTVTSTSTTTTSPRLTGRGYKDKGRQKAELSWSGLVGSSVDIYRDGTKINTKGNDGAMTDAINQRGGGSYTYKVCVSGTTTCTNQATVSF